MIPGPRNIQSLHFQQKWRTGCLKPAMHPGQILHSASIIQYNMQRERPERPQRPSKREEDLEGPREGAQDRAATGSYRLSESESEDIFEPEYHTMKKLHLPIRRRLSKGVWTLEENKIYVEFLQAHLESFRSEAQRRVHRVFCQMSEELHRRRTPDQCRSHHQKLLARYPTVEAMIHYLREKIRESEQLYPCRRRTRFIGKLHLRKQQEAEEVERVEEVAVGTVKTFKNSSRVVFQIREGAVESYAIQ